MSHDNSSIDIAGWAQVLATAFAGIGLVYSAISFRLMAKSTAMDWLFRFQERLDDSARQIVDATDADREHRFRDHLNFLEICCLALQNKVVPKALINLVRDSVVDNLATIQAFDEWHSVFEASITHPSTFDGMSAFIKKHRRSIDALCEERRNAKK